MPNDRPLTLNADPTQALKILTDTGLLLAREHNIDTILRSTLDAGLQLTDATFGAFFHANAADSKPRWKTHLAGSAAHDPTLFPFGTPDDRLIHSFFGNGIKRHHDISTDAAYGTGTPWERLANIHTPVRSYFAIPVHDTHSALLGGMMYGHHEPNIFGEPVEALLASVAAQAGRSIENVRLRERLNREVNVTGQVRQLQRETSDRLARTLEAASDAIFLVDRNWRFTYLNPAAERAFAHGRQLVGMTMTAAFPGAASLFADHYVSVMAGQGPTEFTEFYETLGLWLSVKAYPTPDGVAVFVHDVTEAHNAARARAEADRRLQQALDAAQMGTFSWDRASDALEFDGRAAALFHADPHVPVTRTQMRSHLVMPEDQALTTDALQRAIDTGTHYTAEYRVKDDSGKIIWLCANGIPTFAGETKQVTGMVGTVQDVTARRVQEDAMRQSEKLAATGRLAATIAHEINNPLEAVTNLIYLVKTDPTIPPSAQQLLETADAELARVAQIAQQTLGFYRDTTRPVSINVNALLQGVVDLFERKLNQKKINPTLDLGPGLRVFGLQGELRQVFSNLIVNAIDATPAATLEGPERSLVIRARAAHSHGIEGVSVMICDQGTGIDDAARKQLFTPFFTTKQAVGTGLGLWVTRGMLDKQGGSIRFRSSAIKPTGTIFRVFLPSALPILEISPTISTVIQ